MPIPVQCECGHKMMIKESFAGRGIRCRECQKPLRVPEIDEIDPWNLPSAEPVVRSDRRRREKPRQRQRRMPDDVDTVFRVVKGISLFYGLVFVIFALGGLIVTFGEREPDDPPRWFGVLCIPVGLVGAVASDSVRKRKMWALKTVRVFSAVYLIAIPIGTILGWYFLSKSGQLDKYFE